MRRLKHHCKRLTTCSTTAEFLVRARGSEAQILPDHFKLSKILELVAFLGVLPLRQAQGRDFGWRLRRRQRASSSNPLSPTNSSTTCSPSQKPKATPGLAPWVHVHFSRLSHSSSV